jgi:signal transduction histidine kinase
LFVEQKAKTQFTQMINATVSHELRNPLNSIIAKNLEKEKLYEEMKRHFDLLEVRNRENHSFIKCIELL